MLHIGERNVKNDFRFKWGLKTEAGKEKGYQFYESFFYNGLEYFLHDCVYIFHNSDTETTIGKLVQMFETTAQERRVKVVLFIRPIELRNFLIDVEPRWNEIFLACGEGAGVSKCYFLILCKCVDKTLEVFKVSNMAFFSTHMIITLANQEDIIGKCNVVCTLKDRRNPQPSALELSSADYIFYRTFDVKKCTIQENFPDEIDQIEVKFFFNRGQNTRQANSDHQKNLGGFAGNSSLLPKFGQEKTSISSQKGVDHVQEINSGSKDQRLSSDNHKAPVETETRKISQAQDNPRRRAFKELSHATHSELPPRKKMKGVLDGKGRNGGPVKGAYNVKASETSKRAASESKVAQDNPRRRAFKELSPATHSEPPPRKKMKDVSGGKGQNGGSVKGAYKKPIIAKRAASESKVAPDMRSNKRTQLLKVAKKPIIDRSKWFKQPSWEDRLRIAQDAGTLVLLENLDSTFSALEVEDLVQNALEQEVEAKMLPCSAICNPYYGKAFVIFDSEEAAETALRNLTQRCLILSDGRPIIGSRGILADPSQRVKFVGHITIPKCLRRMHNEEMKNAVSTSHCSQPNTLEYEMAMEWRLLQKQSDLWWKKLHEEQKREVLNLKQHLKSNHLRFCS